MTWWSMILDIGRNRKSFQHLYNCCAGLEEQTKVVEISSWTSW